MTKKKTTLAERLAPMTFAEIDAMSDEEVAELMEATPAELAEQPAWEWRESAKAATNEAAERLRAAVDSGRARVITDPDEIKRRLGRAEGGGRPRLGNGDSVPIHARLAPELAAELDAAAERTGRGRSEIIRDALRAYLEAS
jgi:hypothetical protein